MRKSPAARLAPDALAARRIDLYRTRPRTGGAPRRKLQINRYALVSLLILLNH